MLVVNLSHDPLILTEYNGKKFCFRKNVPVEIEPKVYNNIILSGHISAEEIVIYQLLIVEVEKEKKPQTITDRISKVVVNKIKIDKKRGKR